MGALCFIAKSQRLSVECGVEGQSTAVLHAQVGTAVTGLYYRAPGGLSVVRFATPMSLPTRKVARTALG